MPHVRARHLKTKMAAVNARPDREAIRTALPPELIRGVEEMHGMGWLPIEWDVIMARVFNEVLGPDQHRAFATQVILDSFDGPLLGQLAGAAFAIMGPEPGKWAKWIHRGWNILFKDVGEWVIETENPGDVRLQIRQLPKTCMEDSIWLRSVASSLSALQARAGVPGRTDLLSFDTANAAAVYAVRWSPTLP